jgi:hypothetical protein
VGYEELDDGRPERDPTGLSPWNWTALAVVLVLAGAVFLAFRGPAELSAGPGPNDGPGPSSAVSPRSGLALTARKEPLGFGRICPPITAGKALVVSFNLVNVGTRAITVMDVEPLPPAGGLRPLGPNRSGGTCEQPGSEAPGGLLGPGATQLITMRFRRPPECPQPVPARVRLRVHQMVGTTTVLTHSDLGAITVDPCPAPP